MSTPLIRYIDKRSRHYVDMGCYGYYECKGYKVIQSDSLEENPTVEHFKELLHYVFPNKDTWYSNCSDGFYVSDARGINNKPRKYIISLEASQTDEMYSTENYLSTLTILFVPVNSKGYAAASTYFFEAKRKKERYEQSIRSLIKKRDYLSCVNDILIQRTADAKRMENELKIAEKNLHLYERHIHRLYKLKDSNRLRSRYLLESKTKKAEEKWRDYADEVERLCVLCKENTTCIARVKKEIDALMTEYYKAADDELNNNKNYSYFEIAMETHNLSWTHREWIAEDYHIHIGLAVGGVCLNTLKMYLEMYPDSINHVVKDTKGNDRTALDYAYGWKRNESFINMMREHGAKRASELA